MPQTDRQTDKATWWSVTAWPEEARNVLLDNTKWPAFVKYVHGGLEKAPNPAEGSDGIHFQGAVQCIGQQRFSAMKAWLPNVNWSPARSVDALKKYVMKSETAIGDKTVTENSIKFHTADEICIELAKEIFDDWDELWEFKTDNKHYMFEQAVCRMLRKDRRLAGQLMNPSLRKWFEFTKHVWYDYAKKELEAAEAVLVPAGP